MIQSLRMQPNRKLYFQELPMPPAPGPEEVQIRMAFASICGYDMMMLRGSAAYPLNGYLGHEGSGIITAVGEHVRALRPGDRVTINPYTPCGLCDACRSNRSEYCTNPGIGYSNLMTEYLNIRQQQVFRLPEQVSLRAGSLIEPLMMAMHAVSKAKLGYGRRVILLGCGAMGQIILKLVRQYPVRQIVVVKPVAEKRAAALHFGADVVIDPNTQSVMTEALRLTGGIGYDAVIEVSGDRKSAELCVNLVARGGSVVFFGLYGMDYNLELNLFTLYWKDATLSAVCVPSGQFPAAIAMAKQLKLEEVISCELPFSKGIEAFREKSSGREAKVMLCFEQEKHKC